MALRCIWRSCLKRSMELWRTVCPLFFAIVFITLITRSYVLGRRLHVCGSLLTQDKGYIHTPNFPEKFPEPIFCRWIIHASQPGSQIAVFLTQFYVNQNIYITQYQRWENETHNAGSQVIPNSGDLAFFVISVPYLVIEFRVEKIGNMHLRVENFLMDVYGFNITYQINMPIPPMESLCSAYMCSMLGNCYVDDSYRKFFCSCFDGFHGDRCQYGPLCDPDNGFNTCFNGGRCRYFYGSKINQCECPKNFDGPQCETKLYDIRLPKCVRRNCQQNCTLIEDEAHCSCFDGYELNADNRTCRHAGRVTFATDLAVERAEGTRKTATYIENCLLFQLKRLIRNSGIIADHVKISLPVVLRQRQTEEDNHNLFFFSKHTNHKLMLSFRAKQSEKGQADIIIKKFTQRLTSCSLTTTDRNHTLLTSSGVYGTTIQVWDEGPIYEGTLFALSCETTGSVDTEFTWLHNNHPVSVSKSVREMWTDRQHGRNGKQYSALSMYHAHPMDEGTFTCVATDGIFQDSSKIYVNIVSKPLINIKPLAITTKRNSKVSVICMTRQDVQSNFVYRWYLGDDRLIPGPHIVMEPLAVTGSKLTLNHVQESATYTCEVEGASGKARASVRVAVHPGSIDERDRTKFCQPANHSGITWGVTPANATDAQKCPTHLFDGIAKRKCLCFEETSHCQWDRPNLSQCTTYDLSRINMALQKLRLGYQHIAPHRLLEKLEFFVELVQDMIPIAGDLKLMSEILVDIQDYQDRFVAEGGSWSTLKSMMNLTDFIIASSLAITTEERKETRIGLHILRVLEKLGMSWRGRIRRNLVKADHFDYYLHAGNLTNGTYSISPTADEKCHVTVTVNKMPEGAALTLHLMETSHRSLHLLLPSDTISEKMELNSPITMVYATISDKDVVGSVETLIDLTIPHLKTLHRTDVSNASRCVRWNFTKSLGGAWLSVGCETILINANHTTCRCDRSGHFALLSAKELPPVGDSLELPPVPLITYIGCITAVCGFTFLTMLYVCCCGDVKTDNRVLHLNFCFAMIVINALFLSTLQTDVNLLLCQGTQLVAMHMHVMAFVTQLLEAIQLCMWTRNGQQLGWWKYVLLCWGLSTAPVVLATVLVVLRPSYPTTLTFCWIHWSSWQMFVLIITISLVIMTTVGCLCAFLSLFYRLPGEDKGQASDNPWVIVTRLSLQMSLLSAWCASGLLALNLNHPSFYLAFGSMDILLLLGFSLSNFFLHRPNREYVQSKCRSMKKARFYQYIFTSTVRTRQAELRGDESVASFRAFLRPQTVATEITYWAEERDRKRYTRERIEQLRSMLGSSSLSEGENSRDSGVYFNASSNNHTPNTESRRRSSASRLPLIGFISRRSSVNKPERGRSFILEEPVECVNTGETIQLRELNDATRIPSRALQRRRKSTPDPFPEIKLDDSLGSRPVLKKGDKTPGASPKSMSAASSDSFWESPASQRSNGVRFTVGPGADREQL